MRILLRPNFEIGQGVQHFLEGSILDRVTKFSQKFRLGDPEGLPGNGEPEE